VINFSDANIFDSHTYKDFACADTDTNSVYLDMGMFNPVFSDGDSEGNYKLTLNYNADDDKYAGDWACILTIEDDNTNNEPNGIKQD
jgi:hypothetical protein